MRMLLIIMDFFSLRYFFEYGRHFCSCSVEIFILIYWLDPPYCGNCFQLILAQYLVNAIVINVFLHCLHSKMLIPLTCHGNYNCRVVQIFFVNVNFFCFVSGKGSFSRLWRKVMLGAPNNENLARIMHAWYPSLDSVSIKLIGMLWQMMLLT